MSVIVRIFLCLALTSPIFGEKPLLAVLPVKVFGAEVKKLFTEDDIGYMSDAIRAEASRLLGVHVQILSQLQIEKLVMANAQECSGAGCFAGFLKTISADYGLQPTVRFAAGKLRLTLEMASSQATIGMREYSQSNNDVGKNDLIEKSKDLASELYQQLLGELVIPVEQSSSAKILSSSSIASIPTKIDDGMVAIPAGCFDMGSNDGEADEKPVHRVCLNAYHMDKYEVTQNQYQHAIGSLEHLKDGVCWAFNLLTDKWEPGAKVTEGFIGGNKPMLCVDWEEAQTYCAKQGKRLPTEAEFEYAARAGTRTKYFWGDDPAQGCQYANGSDQTVLSNGGYWNSKMNCSDGYGDAVAPVGSYQPNPWGLYDVAGNVWEWTSDWYGSDYYASSPSQNPTGSASGLYRVYRGGVWDNYLTGFRSSDRQGGAPGIRSVGLGFRCVNP